MHRMVPGQHMLEHLKQLRSQKSKNPQMARDSSLNVFMLLCVQSLCHSRLLKDQPVLLFVSSMF